MILKLNILWMKLFLGSNLHYRLGCDVQQYNTEFHILHTHKHTHVCRERQFLLSKFVCRQFHTFSMHTKYGHFHFLPLFSVTCPTNLYLSSSYFCIFFFWPIEIQQYCLYSYELWVIHWKQGIIKLQQWFSVFYSTQ